MDDLWLHEHMSSILIGVEIMWVGGVLAVIVFYLVMKRRLRKKNKKRIDGESDSGRIEHKKGIGR
jgi:uncharacterized membrane protein YdjX (TVP38/TMEM64 family)